jgi:hypothetical protein
MSNWRIYHNKRFGFEIGYPADQYFVADQYFITENSPKIIIYDKQEAQKEKEYYKNCNQQEILPTCPPFYLTKSITLYIHKNNQSLKDWVKILQPYKSKECVVGSQKGYCVVQGTIDGAKYSFLIKIEDYIVEFVGVDWPWNNNQTSERNALKDKIISTFKTVK